MTPDEPKDRGLRVKWYAEICAALEPIALPVDASYVAGWMAARDAAATVNDKAADAQDAVGMRAEATTLRLMAGAIRALTPTVASPAPPLDVAQAAREALHNIRELNMTAEDENGHRWANSDLIDQEIAAALRAIAGETK